MYWTAEALEVESLMQSALRTLTNLIVPRRTATSWTKLTSFSGNLVCNTKRKNRKQRNGRNRKEEWEGACFWSVAKWRSLQAVSECHGQSPRPSGSQAVQPPRRIFSCLSARPSVPTWTGVPFSSLQPISLTNTLWHLDTQLTTLLGSLVKTVISCWMMAYKSRCVWNEFSQNGAWVNFSMIQSIVKLGCL